MPCLSLPLIPNLLFSFALRCLAVAVSLTSFRVLGYRSSIPSFAPPCYSLACPFFSVASLFSTIPWLLNSIPYQSLQFLCFTGLRLALSLLICHSLAIHRHCSSSLFLCQSYLFFSKSEHGFSSNSTSSLLLRQPFPLISEVLFDTGSGFWGILPLRKFGGVTLPVFYNAIPCGVYPPRFSTDPPQPPRTTARAPLIM